MPTQKTNKEKTARLFEHAELHHKEHAPFTKGIIFAIIFGIIGAVILYKSFAGNPNLPADLNNDNIVNVLDLSIMLGSYGTTNAAADINNDGNVNIQDLSILLSNFGKTYSPTNTTSLGILRISSSQPIPSDMSKYKLLILDGASYSQVAGLKAKWPQLKIIGYKNLAFAVDYSTDPVFGNAGISWSEAQAHPEWFLLDPSGNRVHSVPYPTDWFVDPASTTYEDAWYQNTLSFLKAAPWDGVFMDDTNADNGFHLNNNYGLLAKYPTRDAYRAAVRTMLASVGPRIKSAGYIALPNIGASWDQPDVWADWATLTSGALREHFMKWGESTDPVFVNADWQIHANIEKAVEGAGRMFVALTYGESTDTARQTYVRASFLLFWDPNTGSIGIWNPGYGTAFESELGLPTAAAVQSGAVWTRQFQHGSVRVDTSAGTATINVF